MKFVCQVCGYVHEGDSVIEKCPVCGAPSEKFTVQADEMVWAAEHVVGVAQGSSEDIMMDLRANLTANAQKWECIWQWQESLTEKVILRSVLIMKKLHGKKQSMLQNLLNC